MSNVIQLESRPPQTPGELIESAKVLTGVTQVELASRISASKDQLYRWKTGKVEMPEETRSKLTEIITQCQDTVTPTTCNASKPNKSDKPKSHRSIAWEKFYEAHRHEGLNLEVIPFLEMAYNFGFKFPGHVDQAGRASQAQVEQVIKEHGRSYETLTNWITTFLVSSNHSSSVSSVIDTLKSKMHRLAMAKMDLTSIFKQTIDKDQFSVQAYAATMEVENDIKELMKVYLEDGGVIYRNFFRLTSATNESLSSECTTFDEKSGDVTQYFTLPERTILREILSLKSMLSR
jgi:hypothetical protein